MANISETQNHPSSLQSFLSLEKVGYAAVIATTALIVHRSLISPWVEQNCTNTSAKWAVYAVEILTVSACVAMAPTLGVLYTGLALSAIASVAIIIARRNALRELNESSSNIPSPIIVEPQALKLLVARDNLEKAAHILLEVYEEAKAKNNPETLNFIHSKVSKHLLNLWSSSKYDEVTAFIELLLKKGVNALHLYGDDVNDALLEKLNCLQLESLYLSSKNIADIKIIGNWTLEKLELFNCPKEAVANFIAHLCKDCPNAAITLQRLKVGRCNLTDADLQPLQGSNLGLTHLMITEYGKLSRVYLEYVSSFPLKAFTVSSNLNLTQKDLDSLPDSLEELDLSEATLPSDFNFKRLVKLKNLSVKVTKENFNTCLNTSIRDLHLESLRISSRGEKLDSNNSLDLILRAMPLKELVLPDEYVRYFPGLEGKEIHTLEVGKLSASERHLSDLSKLPLQNLKIEWNMPCTHLQELSPNLKQLVITISPPHFITDTDLIAFLNSHPALENLSLSGKNELSDKSLSEIAKNPFIKDLFFSDSKNFTTEGLKTLEKIPSLIYCHMSGLTCEVPESLKKIIRR